MNPEASTTEKIAVPCPVCSSFDSRVYLEPKITDVNPEYLYGSDIEVRGCQNMVRCSQCTHVYESPRFSDDAIIQAYKSAPASRHDSMFDLKVGTFQNALKKCCLGPGNKRKALDIGCASGAFVQAALLDGWDAYGVEPSEGLVEFGRERGLSIFSGTFQELDNTQNYDLITLWDVLEHLTNPREILQGIHKQLSEEGYLIINVPDESSLVGRMVGRRSWWLMSVHLSYFNEQSLRYLLNRVGFTVIEKHSYYQTYTLGYLLKIAMNMNFPFASFALEHMSESLKNVRVPYHAGQTTFVCRKTTTC